MGKRKAKPQVTRGGAGSVPALGGLCGVTAPACRQWFVRADWPSHIPTKPPWTPAQVVEIRAWRAATLKGRGSPASLGERSEREKLIRAKREQAEFNLAVSRGQYLDREEVEAGRLARIYSVRGLLMNLDRKLNQDLRGHSEHEFPGIIRATVREVWTSFLDSAARAAGMRLEDEPEVSNEQA